jgi:hypothetical protein
MRVLKCRRSCNLNWRSRGQGPTTGLVRAKPERKISSLARNTKTRTRIADRTTHTTTNSHGWWSANWNRYVQYTTNRQQHILAAVISICVHFIPIAHITVSHLCIGSDTVYIYLSATSFYYFYCIKPLYFIYLRITTWPKHVEAYCM